MKQHWRIIKEDNSKRWQIQSKAYLEDGTCTGWETLSRYETRKQAITVGMILRNWGEPISWHGGPIKMGIGLVHPSPMEG